MYAVMMRLDLYFDLKNKNSQQQFSVGMHDISIPYQLSLFFLLLLLNLSVSNNIAYLIVHANFPYFWPFCRHLIFKNNNNRVKFKL